jgi:hypothetical protein
MTQDSTSVKVELSAHRFGGADVASIFVTFPSDPVSVNELMNFDPTMLNLEADEQDEFNLKLVCDNGVITILRPDNGDMLNFVRTLNKEGVFALTLHTVDPAENKMVFRVIMAEISQGRILSDTGPRILDKDTMHMHVAQRDQNHDAYDGKVFSPIELAQQMDNRDRFAEATKLDPSQAN